jgi:glycine/D-amino acid oxidase-like deaminating enzyme
VAILGSGVAGLTAAWRLARDGHDDFLLLDGPEPDGNAAGGRFDSPSGPLLHPCGAHYLPLPSMESRGVRELLFELGVIEAEPFSEHPRFSETALVHAPDERLFFDGAWHEGLLPTEQVNAEEAGQHRRFLAEMADLTRRRGRGTAPVLRAQGSLVPGCRMAPAGCPTLSRLAGGPGLQRAQPAHLARLRVPGRIRCRPGARVGLGRPALFRRPRRPRPMPPTAQC